MRTTKWSWPLVLVELIVAVNAVGGAVYGLAGAEDVPREWLDGTPFDTYTVPSLILLVAVGGSMIAAATALRFRHRRAPALSIVAGLILMGWIAVQVLMIAPNGGVSWLQPALFGAGGLVAFLGWQLREATAPTDPSRTHDSIQAGSRQQVELALGLIAIGVGLAIVTLLGPLLAGTIDYHVTETLRNQTIGLDAVSLLVVAPLSVWAALLVLRGHVAGPALALGISVYTTYMLVQYIVGPEYERLPGNNELLFPLYLLLFVFGWTVAVAAWTQVDPARLLRSSRRDRLVGTFVLPLPRSCAEREFGDE